MKIAAIVVLVAVLPVLEPVLDAQDQDTQRAPLVITIPPELLTQVQVQQPAQAAPVTSKPDLMIPNLAYLATASADWATSFSGCTPSCTTRDVLLPDVSRPGLSIPLGLAIDTLVIWSLNTYVAPRWPHAAQGALYLFSILRSVDAEQHVQTSERRERGLP